MAVSDVGMGIAMVWYSIKVATGTNSTVEMVILPQTAPVPLAASQAFEQPIAAAPGAQAPGRPGGR